MGQASGMLSWGWQRGGQVARGNAEAEGIDKYSLLEEEGERELQTGAGRHALRATDRVTGGPRGQMYTGRRKGHPRAVSRMQGVGTLAGSFSYPRSYRETPSLWQWVRSCSTAPERKVSQAAIMTFMLCWISQYATCIKAQELRL